MTSRSCHAHSQPHQNLLLHAASHLPTTFHHDGGDQNHLLLVRLRFVLPSSTPCPIFCSTCTLSVALQPTILASTARRPPPTAYRAQTFAGSRAAVEVAPATTRPSTHPGRFAHVSRLCFSSCSQGPLLATRFEFLATRLLNPGP
jgi:hypothetical protein